MALYQLGRLGGYAALGVLFGTIGWGLDATGQFTGMQRASIWAAAVAVAAFGVYNACRLGGVRWSGGAGFEAFKKRLFGLNRYIQRWGPRGRAVGVGALTALMPCGWLWAFVAVAAATGHPLGAAAVMAAFWFGGLPALVLTGTLAKSLLNTQRPRLAMAASIVVSVVGAGVLIHQATADVPLGINPNQTTTQALDAAAKGPACCKKP